MTRRSLAGKITVPAKCSRVDLRVRQWPNELMRGDLDRVLFDEPAINRRLDELAQQISNDYRDRELTVIAVLTGSLMFMADLLRRVPLPVKLDCLSVASYHGKAHTMGKVTFKEVTLAEGASVRELLDQIYAKQPALRSHDKRILIGADLEFVDRNHKLKPGEEIAIMPPMQGG